MKAVYDPAQARHNPQFFLVKGQLLASTEQPERAVRLLQGLDQLNIELVSPTEFGSAPIEAIHTSEYLEFLKSIYAQWRALPNASAEVISNIHPLRHAATYPESIIGRAGWHMADTACPIGEHTWDAACRSANTALTATQLVLDGLPMSYALCRPPGHHAYADMAGGFCFLNNVAIAAQYARSLHPRVAILDVDVHHGNGTQGIFYQRADVLTVSIHADPHNFYPFYWGHSSETGEGEGVNYNLNLPLPLLSGDDVFLAAMDQARKAVLEFDPGVLLIALGLDASETDPLRGLSVTTEGFRKIGQAIASFGLPTVFVQEGGYLSDILSDNLAAVLSGAEAGEKLMQDDPFYTGIEGFGADLRAGKFTIEQVVSYYLDRIAQHNPKLQAFQHVDTDSALKAARGLDLLLASGSDLGPLMGVPIGVKDIITVDGMPVTNGSLHSTAHLNGPEGSVVKKFRQLGCVILGKTKTVEFALGATGVNEARGTPWNPADLQLHRVPGGSSSGSAVATAAGLCAFALGSDTGGSIRIPACYTGLFGHKTSMGFWPTDGVFPLSPSLDSIGPLCRTAADAALIHECFVGAHVTNDRPLNGLRFAKPSPVFFEELDTEVQDCFDLAVAALEKQGVEIIDIELPESLERNDVFPVIVGSELISTLTASGFAQAEAKMDTVTRTRAAIGLDVSAEDYLSACRRHRQLKQIAAATFTGVDAWISPTVPMLPMPVDDLKQSANAERALLSSRNTQLGNLYGLCAASLPVQQLQAGSNLLPVGFQLMMPAGADAGLLAISRSVEKLLGPGPRLDV